MITLIVVFLIGLAGGFGLGRVKNAKKLAAAQDVLTSIETGAVLDAKIVVSRMKSILNP